VTDEEIDALSAGLELDIAVERSVMPGNVNLDQLDQTLLFIARDLIAHYSTDMQAAWQVILMIRGWSSFRRQQFLQELLKEVSKGAGFLVLQDELLWNMRPEHVCRAALKAVRTVAPAASRTPPSGLPRLPRCT
jgi:hypothetical protein